MAQNRHADAVAACLLLGDERTWLGRGPRRAIVGGALLTLLVALIVGRLWFHHHMMWRRSAWSGWPLDGGITDTWDCRSFLRPMDRMARIGQFGREWPL